MNTYIVRLTIEGEQTEQTMLAEDAVHAIRLALADWHRYSGEEAMIVSVRQGDATLPAARYEPRRSIA